MSPKESLCPCMYEDVDCTSDGITCTSTLHGTVPLAAGKSCVRHVCSFSVTVSFGLSTLATMQRVWQGSCGVLLPWKPQATVWRCWENRVDEECLANF